MPLQYLKKAPKTSKSDASDVNEIVQNILDEIEQGGDEAALKYARKFDNYDGNIELTKSEIEAACALVPERLKADIRFAHDNVKRFAQAQKATLADIEYEVIPGLIAGQKSIPVRAAGCYVPGGRYSHIASAIMTVTTAKVAGCKKHRRLFAATARGGDCPGDCLCGAYRRCRPNFGARWGAGDCRDDVWSVWLAESGYSCWSRQSVRGRGQADPVWPCGH